MIGERSRQEVLRRLFRASETGELTLIPQGVADFTALQRAAPDQTRDVDFWAPVEDRERVRAILTDLGGHLLCTSEVRAWLSHDVYLVPTDDGYLQVDVTIGDLMVGPLCMAVEEQVRSSLQGGRLTGLALIADLLLRPLARGRIVEGARLQRVLAAWRDADRRGRGRYVDALAKNLGRRCASLCETVLDGNGGQNRLIWYLRFRLLRKSITSVAAGRVAVRKLCLVLMSRATRRSRPFGRFHRGLLVAFIGTDGAGKSSTIQALEAALTAQRMRWSTHYLGRARGNLPGIGRLRDKVGKKIQAAGPNADLYSHKFLNRLGSWYYAFEYGIRLIRPFLEARLLGKITFCDRYVYDIGLIPFHSRIARRFSISISPRPDIIVWLDASADVIRSRKQERSLEDIEQHQAFFGKIATSGHARCNTIVVRTDRLTLAESRRLLIGSINFACHQSFISNQRRRIISEAASSNAPDA